MEEPEVCSADLRAPLSADATACELHAVIAQDDLFTLCENKVAHLFRRVGLHGAVRAEAAQNAVDLVGANDAAKVLPAVARDNAHNARVVRGQPVPDREQRAGEQVERAFVVLRRFRRLLFPRLRPFALVNLCGFLVQGAFHIDAPHAAHGAFQRETTLYLALFVGLAGNFVDGADASIFQPHEALEVSQLGIQRRKRDNLRLAVDLHLDIARICTARVLADHGLIQNFHLVRAVVFKAHIDRTIGNGGVHHALKGVVELLECCVLLVHFKGQNTVEEFADVAQVGASLVDAAPFVKELVVKAELFQHFLVGALIERSKRVHSDGIFKVVLFPEYAAARLALAFCQRAELVEAAGNGRSEAFLSHDVCRHKTEDGGARLIAAVRSAEALHRLARAPPGLQEVMHALLLVLCAQVSVVAAPCAARIGENQNALFPVLEHIRVGNAGGCASALHHTLHVSVLVGLLHHAARPARDLGNIVRAECVKQHFQRAVRHFHLLQLGNQVVAHLHGLLVQHGLAVLVQHGAGSLLAVLVGVLLVQLDGERLFKHLDKRVGGGEVQVVQRAACRLVFGEGAVCLRRVCIRELKNAAPARGQLAAHILDHGRHSHRRDDLVIKALLRGVERADRAASRHAVLALAGDLQRLVHVLQHLLPRAAHGVVNLRLHRRKVVLQGVVLHVVIADAAGHIDAHRFHIAGDKLHCSQAAVADLRYKIVDVVECRPLAPQPEPIKVTVLRDVRCAGRAGVHNAGIGERLLQIHASNSLCRGLRFAALALDTDKAAHIVRFVERDHAVEVSAEPRFQVVNAAFPALCHLQGVIGGEHDAMLIGDGLAELIFAEIEDSVLISAEIGPIAAGVIHKARFFRYPHGLCAALQIVVHDDAGELSALADARTVADEVAPAPAVRKRLTVRLSSVHDVFKLRIGENALLGDPRGKRGRIGRVRRKHRAHCRALHELCGVLLRALDVYLAGGVGGINAVGIFRQLLYRSASVGYSFGSSAPVSFELDRIRSISASALSNCSGQLLASCVLLHAALISARL